MVNRYWYNKQELLQKAKEKYDNCGGKQKHAKYYLQIKDTMEQKVTNKYKNLSEEQKQAKREYSKDRYEKMKEKAS